VPTEVIAGKRPGIPEHSSSMKGPWNLARGCWDHFPQKRPNSRTILDRLQEAFMNTGDVTHITSREPGPMLTQGERLRSLLLALMSRSTFSRATSRNYNGYDPRSCMLLLAFLRSCSPNISGCNFRWMSVVFISSTWG
jgi:hypothetical protein